MKRLAYTVAQIVWGLPQTVAGAVVFLLYSRCPHFEYHGAVATVWPHASSMSLGMFVFLACDPREPLERDMRDRNMLDYRCSAAHTLARQVLVHEYGHTIQSLILGPLYLPLVGLPSLLWAQLPPLKRMRAYRGMSYYRFVTERTANRLGEAVCREQAPH